MTQTEIAARLRMASAEMNALAALTEDTDWPDEVVPAFVVNFVFDQNMFPRLLKVGQAYTKTGLVQPDSQQGNLGKPRT